MPCLRQTSVADNPAACSFSTLMICSSVICSCACPSPRRNGLYPKLGASTESRSLYHPRRMNLLHVGRADPTQFVLQCHGPFLLVDDGPIADAFLAQFPRAKQ